jgi:hypothetical protein
MMATNDITAIVQTNVSNMSGDRLNGAAATSAGRSPLLLVEVFMSHRQKRACMDARAKIS